MRTKGAKREVHLYEIMRRINEKMNKKTRGAMEKMLRKQGGKEYIVYNFVDT